jgi:uroporphyrin-III C-methyltransferase/precorrin-2 dehydrogenase/sirohydrochlorin ferrochelatase
LREELLEDAASLDGAKGRVTLVGAGPGDPELLTLKAVRVLQSAEVILYDDLVAPEILEFARREAKRILVGKTGHGPACKQEEINELMLRLARQGRHVVRLKGGDPGIFGRATEEIEACRRAGIEVAVVPGITAAQGAAAALKISLTRRGYTRRLQFVTGHARDGGLPADLDWGAIADPLAMTALYMPRRTLAVFRDRAIGNGLLPETPAVAVSSVSRHDECRIFSSISELPELVSRVDPQGPLLVLIGNGLESEAASETRRAADAPQRSFAAGSRTRKGPTPVLF